MNDGELARTARRLGVATSYVGSGGDPRDASPAALRAVCDLLLAGAGDGAASESGPESGSDAESGSGPIDAVVLVRGGRLRSGVVADFERPLAIEVTLDDGSTVDLGPIRSASSNP